MLKYDEVMNQQRKVIYAARHRILRGDDLGRQVHAMLIDLITGYVTTATVSPDVTEWDVDALWAALNALYPVGVKDHRWKRRRARTAAVMRKVLLHALIKDAERAIARREKEFGELTGVGAMRKLERDVLLDVIDRKWREHLYEMDYLKEGIGLRALAQRDPLVEFQREGYDMFVAMLEAIKEESLVALFQASVKNEPAPEPVVTPAPLRLAEFTRGAAQDADLSAVGGEGDGRHTVSR